MQISTHISDFFTGSRIVQTIQTRHCTLNIFVGRINKIEAFFEALLNLQTHRTTEYHQIQQRVTAQTVCTVNRNTRNLTSSVQAFNDHVIAIFILSQRLTTNIGRYATHHVVTGWNNRNRLFNRVSVSKSTRQLQDTWQLGIQGFFTQMIQLQVHVVTILTTTTAFQNFQNHRTGNNITARQVFGIRSITLHKALTVFIDQVTTFTTTAFGYQRTSTGNTRRVELPHFHVLHRNTGTQRHTNTVTGVDQSIGGRLINTTCTTRCQHGCFGFDVNGFTGFDIDRDNTRNLTFSVLHQINGIPFIQEGSTTLQVALIKSVQQSVTSTVSRRTGTSSLSRVIRTFRLTTERTLVDTTILETRERQTHVFQFENRLGTYRTHVFDRILVTDIIGTLNGVVHVPAPIIIRISRSNRTGNTTLSRYSV